jgi:myosin-6
MEILYKTNSHFIRCIKPNGQQKPNVFVNDAVMTQLRYSGMCAALVLMQAGFPTRISFDDLFSRYAPKMPAMMARLKPQTFCEALLVALDLDGGKDFQMGLTKVFFRSGKLKTMDLLTDTESGSVDHIVAKVRKWLARKRFYAAAHAVVSLNRLNRLILGIRWATFVAKLIK